MKQYYVTPLLHPSGIVRGAWESEAPQITYLKRIKQDPTPTIVDINEKPPGSVLYAPPEAVYQVHKQARELGAIYFDLETAGPHIICAGLMAMSLEEPKFGTPICLRFRRQGGDLYFDKHEHEDATKNLYNLMGDADVAKVGQNIITFDIPELLDLGFEVRGRLVDTMVMAHTAYSEQKKSLQFLATAYLGAPVWKTLTDIGDEGEGKA